MVLPASSRLWFSHFKKVGQSWVLMTIFGRVLCPLQPSCLPPLHAARALLFGSFPLAVSPHFLCFLLILLLLHHQNRTLFNPLLVCLLLTLPLIAPFPSSSLPLILLVHYFVFSPQTHFFRSSSFSPLHPSLLLPLFLSFSYFLRFPFSPLSFSSRKLCTSRFTAGCIQGPGSAGPWPILTPSLCS